MSTDDPVPGPSGEERSSRQRTRRAHRQRGNDGPSSERLTAAFDDAAARAQAAFAGAAPRDELDAFFAAIRSGVRSVLSGRPALADLPRSLATERVLERVRIEFIDEVHGQRQGLDSAQALDVLGALGEVQRALCAPGRERGRYGHLETDRAALELAVEVAHDMRSPLTAILFLVDMLRSGRSGPVAPAQARQLGIVYGAAFGLNQLATDVIDHVKGERLTNPAAAIAFSVTELLHSVRDILAPMTEERRLEMQLESIEEDGRVGFPVPLHRILLNLATNALKYTARGSVAIRARQLAGPRVRFEVTDTGPGIPRRVQARLFEPFRTELRSDKRRIFSSAGLGLTICRDLVAALGGRLAVSSLVGKGTRFSFELDLPLAEPR